MLTNSQDIMLYQIQSMADEIAKETSKLTGKAKKADGTITLLIELGTSRDRLLDPTIRVEIISYSLAKQKEKMFLFDSIDLAYEQVTLWYQERKIELVELSKLDRNNIADKINSKKSNKDAIDVEDA
jgi:hypothetical protein